MAVVDERKWLLRRWWGLGGWSRMAGCEDGTKKWEAHKAWLHRSGYLENDPEYPDHFRMTDAGIKWLEG